MHSGSMSVSARQAVMLACEKLRDALSPVAADKGGDLSWTELVAAAEGDANGFGPSKARHPSPECCLILASTLNLTLFQELIPFLGPSTAATAKVAGAVFCPGSSRLASSDSDYIASASLSGVSGVITRTVPSSFNADHGLPYAVF